MGDVEGENYDSLLRNLTNANTMLLNDASETLEFNSIDALDQVHCFQQCGEMIQFQGAGTLYTITSQLVKGGDIGKTLDMKVEFQSCRCQQHSKMFLRVGRLLYNLLRI